MVVVMSMVVGVAVLLLLLLHLLLSHCLLHRAHALHLNMFNELGYRHSGFFGVLGNAPLQLLDLLWRRLLPWDGHSPRERGLGLRRCHDDDEMEVNDKRERKRMANLSLCAVRRIPE